MIDRVGIGLIGCGAFGESHLQALRGNRRASVVAAYDLDRARAERVAAAYGIPRVCGSVEEVCALEEVDCLDVVTSEAEHRAPAVCGLRAGKHVFVEKPIATSVEDGAAMIEEAHRAGRILMVGQILRFEARYALLRERIAAGGLGDIVSMHARRNRRKSLLPVYGRTHPALENCIHDLDLMLWYHPRPVRRVRAWHRNATGGRNPDTFWGVLEFEGGALGVVETIWLMPEAGVGLDDSFQAVGTAGVANLQLLPAAFTVLREGSWEAVETAYDRPLADELAYFVDCVAEGRPCAAIQPEEALRAVRVVLALIESARTGADVEIAWD